MKRLVLLGTAGTFSIRVMAAFFGLAMNVLLARVLPISEFGIISLGLSWLNIAAILACFGTDIVSVRYVAEANIRGDHAQIYNVMCWGRKLTLSLGAVIWVLSCGLIYLMYSKYPIKQLLALFIIVMAIPFFAFAINRASVLRGIKKVVSAAAIRMLVRPIAITILVLLVSWFSDWQPSLMSISIVIFLAHVVMVWIGNSATRGLAPKQTTLASHSQKMEWLKMAKPLALINVMQMLAGNLDVVLVGYFGNAGSAGIYRASSQLANLVSFGLVASGSIVAPLIAELYSKGKYHELRKTLRFSVGLTAVMGVSTSIIMAIAGPFALHLFGTAYGMGYHALLILLIAQTISALSGPIESTMAMTGHQNQAARIFTIGAMLSAILDIVLIPIYGIIGAALANVIGVAVWNLLALVFLKSKLNLNPSILVWLKSKGE